MELNDLPQLELDDSAEIQLLIPEGELEVAALVATADEENTGAVWICSEDGGATRFIRKLNPGQTCAIGAVWYDVNIGVDNFLVKAHTLYFGGATTGNKLNLGYFK